MSRVEFGPGEVRKILAYHVGRRSAIKGEDIARIFGLGKVWGGRQIRVAVRELRREGVLILSVTEEPAGYFLAANAAEWRRYGKRMRNRATDLLKTVSEMDKAASAQFGIPEELRPAVQLDLGLR